MPDVNYVQVIPNPTVFVILPMVSTNSLIAGPEIVCTTLEIAQRMVEEDWSIHVNRYHHVRIKELEVNTIHPRNFKNVWMYEWRQGKFWALDY